MLGGLCSIGRSVDREDLFACSRCPGIGLGAQQLLVLSDHVLDVIAFAQFTLELIERLIEYGIEGGQQSMIECGEEMMQDMITEVCEHQKL